MNQERDLLERMKLLEVDHTPDGWPAVQMKDISAMVVMIESKTPSRVSCRACHKLPAQICGPCQFDAQQSLQMQVDRLNSHLCLVHSYSSCPDCIDEFREMQNHFMDLIRLLNEGKPVPLQWLTEKYGKATE